MRDRLYYQLWVYGQRKGLSAVEAFRTVSVLIGPGQSALSAISCR